MTKFFKKLGVLCLLMSQPLYSQESCDDSCCEAKIEDEIPCRGKIDIGPAYVHIDLLDSGVTRHRMDLAAAKGDINYRFWKCLLIKTTFIYGHGHHKNRICNEGVGLGVYIPIRKGFTIAPSAGVIWGNLKTTYKVDLPNVPVPIPVEEKFYSSSPYLGLEVSYTFIPSWRIVLNYQYSWSHTRTTIKPLLKEKSHSQGSNYSALLECDLNQHWSVNVGAAYNVSLTKEKHGLRAYGCKAGVAYWF